MNKYRKRAIVVEVMQFRYNSKDLPKLKEWMGDAMGGYKKMRHPNAIGELHVKTLEDGKDEVKHIATEGDYIIKGIAGEFYPCKPDIFAETYDLV